MKRIRSRRRFGVLLVTLLLVCVVLFIEDRIEAFVPDAKSFVETRIEQALGGRFKLSIGDIDGGLIQPITFNDIKVGTENNPDALPFVHISSIKTNYRIWDVLSAIYFSRQNGRNISRLLSGVMRLDVYFSAADNRASGFLRLTNSSKGADIKGHLNLPSAERIDFTGKIKNGAYDIEIKPKRGLLNAEGAISSSGTLDGRFRLCHISLGKYDIVCDGTMRGEIVTAPNGSKGSAIRASIETKNCVLNYRPFLNLTASFMLSESSIGLTDFSLSDIIRGRGSYQTAEPHNVIASVMINNMSLKWLSLALGTGDAPSIVSGTVNAKCDLKGPISGLRSDIKIEIKNGTLSTLSFDYLMARLKGEGSILRIDDSRITRESGPFVLGGEMDLSKIGKDIMFEKITLVGDDKAINWDGWNSSKVQDVKEITMRKKINDDIDIDFKKFTSEDAIDERLKYADEVQLGYKLNPNDRLKVMFGQDKDFLGIEHKDRF